MANNRLGSALRLLASRGFSSTGNRAGCRSFEGVLACSLKPVRVRLEISDWDFLSYPRIKILERPEHLPALLPHVDTGGNLCYFSPGSVILDRYDPATALSQCIDQASAVLNQIATDPEYRKQDIENEFLAHRGFDQKNYYLAGFDGFYRLDRSVFKLLHFGEWICSKGHDCG